MEWRERGKRERREESTPAQENECALFVGERQKQTHWAHIGKDRERKTALERNEGLFIYETEQ